jgi:hypothetical protein
MILSTILGEIGGLVVDTVRGWSERKKITTEAKTKIEVAKAEAEIVRLQKLAEAEVAWDYEALRQGENSWKDEFWTIVLALPCILVFVPGMDRHILSGFQILDTLPEWYRYALGVAIAAAFGVRKLKDMVQRKK